MASQIDPTKPADGVPAEKADLRANLQAAKDEIEALQGGKFDHSDGQGRSVGNYRLVEVNRGSDYTLVPTDSGKRLVATAPITLTVPAASELGNGFEVQLINDSGATVTIAAPNSSEQLAAGEVGTLIVANGKSRLVKGANKELS